jgi:hypothetical protein
VNTTLALVIYSFKKALSQILEPLPRVFRGNKDERT